MEEVILGEGISVSGLKFTATVKMSGGGEE
jgi:hypothetical protein